MEFSTSDIITRPLTIGQYSLLEVQHTPGIYRFRHMPQSSALIILIDRRIFYVNADQVSKFEPLLYGSRATKKLWMTAPCEPTGIVGFDLSSDLPLHISRGLEQPHTPTMFL